MSAYPHLDFAGIKTYSIRERPHKVHLTDVRPVDETLWAALPSSPAPIRELADLLRAARSKGKPMLWLMGAHSIKVGLSLVLRRLIQDGFVSHLAANGAVPIHEYELATFGRTSEEVGDTLPDGTFGMVEETLRDINRAIRDGAARGIGLGQALAEFLSEQKPPHAEVSVLLRAREKDVPITIHAAIGTDTIYQSPHCDGAAIGQTSYLDFKILAHSISRLGDGGVVVNLGSSVILPEVFVKALSVARNVKGPIGGFTAAVFDMIDHYRPRVNVLQRPTKDGGRSLFVQGRFEQTLPQLARELCGRT
ncbi:MAG: hypothetical protein HYT87_15315 [Nitrospirae bacterium]|nr:hypothetical protein [Nitrospirota bacterium]